jgi:hypothetical protein
MKARRGGEEEIILFIGVKARRKEATSKTKNMSVYNIRLNHRETGWGDVDWIDLTKNKDKWRTFVNGEMNPEVRKLSSGYRTGGPRVMLSSIDIV